LKIGHSFLWEQKLGQKRNKYHALDNLEFWQNGICTYIHVFVVEQRLSNLLMDTSDVDGDGYLLLV
jgi:hypothetical protein